MDEDSDHGTVFTETSVNGYFRVCFQREEPVARYTVCKAKQTPVRLGNIANAVP